MVATGARRTSRLQELLIVAFAYLYTCSLSESCGSKGNKGGGMNAKCPRRRVGGDRGVETIKPLLLESFVRQMSAGRPILFKLPLFFLSCS